MATVGLSAHRPVIVSSNGLVVSDHHLASQAGLEILKQGGNAADAAVTAGAVLSVVKPHLCGLGGDAFMLIYQAQNDLLRGLNGSGRSPYLANREWYLERGMKSIPRQGIYSVTVPGVVDAWATALRECGTIRLAQALEPAIDYAGGFPIYESFARFLATPAFQERADASLTQIYLPNGRAPMPGDWLVQEDLARSLYLLAQGATGSFYRGQIAQGIVACSRERGGLFTPEDFADHTSTWVKPISSVYRGYRVYGLPPNSQSIAFLLALNLLEDYDLTESGHNSANYIHILVEAMKLALADRDKYVADPYFADIPLEKLLSKGYAFQRGREIEAATTAAKDVWVNRVPRGETEATYVGVVDREGNAVSLMQSLGGLFGSGLMVEGTGIVLQNRGAAFSLDGRHINRLEPAKRPYHDLSPAMVFWGHNPCLVFGSLGGDSQVQALMQGLNNLVVFGMDIQEAVEAPRWSVGWEGELRMEDSISAEVQEALERKGHRVVLVGDWSEEVGGLQGIVVDRARGVLMGGADPRCDAYAVGW